MDEQSVLIVRIFIKVYGAYIQCMIGQSRFEILQLQPRLFDDGLDPTKLPVLPMVLDEGQVLVFPEHIQGGLVSILT